MNYFRDEVEYRRLTLICVVTSDIELKFKVMDNMSMIRRKEKNHIKVRCFSFRMVILFYYILL